MSDDKLQDSEGNVYEKTSYGTYEREWSFGQQDYVRGDRTDNAWHPTEQTDDGTPLYPTRSSQRKSSNSDSEGGDGGGALIMLIFYAAAIGIAILAILAYPLLEIIFRRLKSSPEMRRNWAIFFIGSIVTGLVAYGIGILGRNWPYPITLVLIIVLFVCWLLLYRLKLGRKSPAQNIPMIGAFAEYKDGVRRMWGRVAGAVHL